MSRPCDRFDWVIADADAGVRLDRFLADKGVLGTRSQVQRAIEAGCVLVGDRIGRAGARLRIGQQVCVERPAIPQSTVEAEPIGLEVLFEDAHVLVVNKPAGLVVHPAAGHRSGTLVNALLHRWGGAADGLDPLRPGIVHRLDKDTSGVLVVARTAAAADRLSRQFRKRQVLKCYLAIAAGRFVCAAGVLLANLGRHRIDRKRMAVCGRGRRAVTCYEVVESFSEHSLVRVYPETGRTHQIRVHLAALGHPILGDSVYGGRRTARGLIARQALHAESITFTHPVSGKRVTFRAEPPSDFAAVIRRLREECEGGEVRVGSG